MENNFLPKEPQISTGDIAKPSFSNKKLGVYACYTLGAILLLYALFFSAPFKFPVKTIVNVKEKASLRSISLDLQNQDIIRSRIIFEALVIMYGGEKHIISGDYLFDHKASVFEVAKRVSKGDRRLVALKITIPEGFDIKQIADLFNSKLVNFNEEVFLQQVEEKEGYLFPDTYFFFSTQTEQDVLKSLNDNFNKKIANLRLKISASGKTENEILTMASIVEREAKGDQDRELIAGILWKRLRIGMPLQVDAAPITYREKGLPDKPIANPGILAIQAALEPKSSPYLYYIHDKAGNIYYAKSFDEHRINIEKYLK